jgi:agmatinase
MRGFGLLVVPYERTTTYMEGADEGPPALLRDWQRLVKAGEAPAPEALLHAPTGVLSDVGAMKAWVKNATRDLTGEDLLPVLFGGEHTSILGAVSALTDPRGGPGVVYLDAHADLRPSYQGSRFNHACVMRRLAVDEGLPLLPLGIRAFSREEAVFMKERGIPSLAGRCLHRWRELLPPLLDGLPERIYLSVDMDYFDPSVVPGVGTPEPGGGEWYQTLDMLDCILERRKVVGFDVVELCPPREKEASVRAAALIAGHVLTRCLDPSPAAAAMD